MTTAAPQANQENAMCRSIKTLRPPFEEEVTADDIEAAAVQYVRKISGFRKPSKANQKAFDKAVRQVTSASQRLLDALVVPVRTDADKAAG